MSALLIISGIAAFIVLFAVTSCILAGRADDLTEELLRGRIEGASSRRACSGNTELPTAED